MTTTENGLFSVPTREEVSSNNQAIFDGLHKMIGFVPNLYAYYAKSETALGDYLALQNRKNTLNGKQREVINLVTSQINGCRYCVFTFYRRLSAATVKYRRNPKHACQRQSGDACAIGHAGYEG